MKASFLFNILRTIADNLRALIEFTLILKTKVLSYHLKLKVDGTSFSDAESLVTTAHLTREICPRDLKYRKSKTNMGAQNYYLPGVFFPVCPRLDQNKSCPLGISC